jgi:hypothetical protein
MKPITEAEIRGSFVNATKGEIDRMPLPGLHEVIWDSREFLGWRDPGAPLRGYLVHWLDDRPIGILLRASEVTLFTAPKAGESGRNGNSIGTYICDDLACSFIIRITPGAHPLQPSPEELVATRATGLHERLRAFTASVLT